MTDQNSKAKTKSYAIAMSFFALFWLFGEYINLPVRNFLKELFQPVPYWVDHIFFMILAKTILALVVGCVFLKKEEMFLKPPRGRKYIVEGILSSLIIVIVIAVCLKLDGILQFQFEIKPSVMLGISFQTFMRNLFTEESYLAYF